MNLHQQFNDFQAQPGFIASRTACEQAQALKTEIATNEALRRAKPLSYAAICGALLQMAKRGISAHFDTDKSKASGSPDWDDVSA